MPGSGTMPAPSTTYPPPAPAMGVAPAAPETVGPHISYTSNPLTNTSVKLKASPIGKQESPDVVVPPSETKRLEHTPQIPDVVQHQWSLTREVPVESIFSDEYMKTRDAKTRSISLKESLYLALKNNPAVAAASLEPVISLQGVRGSWAVFDPGPDQPDGRAKERYADDLECCRPAAPTGFVQKAYVWDFAINKTLATTNGTLGVTFTNSYGSNNSLFTAVNPAYTPALTLSLNQPLLRNFGNEFATINVRIAESNQKQAQFNYEQQLNDFVLKVGTDYWNVVRAEENLEVADKALAVALGPGAPERD